MTAAEVAFDPDVVHQTEIGAGETCMELVAADAAPGGVVIGAARVDTRADDVEEVGKTNSSLADLFRESMCSFGLDQP